MSDSAEAASRIGLGRGELICYLHKVQVKYTEYLKNDCVLTP
jgi:hypothetical protein